MRNESRKLPESESEAPAYKYESLKGTRDDSSDLLWRAHSSYRDNLMHGLRGFDTVTVVSTSRLSISSRASGTLALAQLCSS